MHKEKRNFLIDLKLKLEDGTVIKYKNKEEIEYEFGKTAEKIVQVEKDGKKYKIKLIFSKIKKGLFGDQIAFFWAETIDSPPVVASMHKEIQDISSRHRLDFILLI